MSFPLVRRSLTEKAAKCISNTSHKTQKKMQLATDLMCEAFLSVSVRKRYEFSWEVPLCIHLFIHIPIQIINFIIT